MARPETTRGRYSVVGSSLRFPLDENPYAYTSITFYRYERSISSEPRHVPVSTIQLPLPSAVTDATSLKISEYDLGFVKMVLDMAQKGGSLTVRSIKESLNKALDATTYAKLGSDVKAFFTDPEKIKAIGTLIPMFGDSNTYQMLSGTIRNPHTTATFQGVVLKPFSFNWKLSARSEDEAKALKEINNHIKNKILPRVNETNPYVLDYPHVVKVKFVNTNNFPETNYAFVDTFQMDIPQIALYRTGDPIVVQMSMTLKELDIRVSEERA